MENSVWRPRAKFVAIVDTILIAASAVIVAVGVTLIATGTFKSLVTEDDAITILAVVYGADTAWTDINLIVVAIIVIVAQLSGVVSLFSAVQIERAPKKALIKAKHWEVVNILLLGIYIVLWICRIPFLVPLSGTTIWRIIGLFIVGRFTQELQLLRTSESAIAEDSEKDAIKENLTEDV